MERGVVIVTKDEDFVRMRIESKSGPPVVWVRIGNTTREALIRKFSKGLDQIVVALEANAPLIELTDS